MTDSNYTALKIVADRSGSVGGFLEDAQGAIDGFVDDQKKAAAEGRKVTISLAQFDDSYELVYPSTPAQDVPAYTVVPRGMTALLDAFGRGITEFGEELAALPEKERPGTVIFALMTDGKENASDEWTRERVFELVTQQREKYGWNIVYLAANQDAVEEGRKFGVADGSSLSIGTDSQSLVGTRESVAEYVAVASASAGPVEFSAESRRRSKRQ